MPDASAPAPVPAPTARLAPSVDPNRKPDAVLFNTGWVPPGSKERGNRQYELIVHFESILGAVEGQTAHIRDVGPGKWLATLSMFDTLNLPEDHPTRPKYPRYDWRDGGNGLQYGYLKPDEIA